MCRVSGSRRYSADLPQGGLEVSCVLTFPTSNAKDVEKAKKLIDQESTVCKKTLANLANHRQFVKVFFANFLNQSHARSRDLPRCLVSGHVD